jgi:hypothetical protein
MTKRDVAAVGCKLLSAYWFATWLVRILYYPRLWDVSGFGEALNTIGMQVLPLILAALLWLYADRLAALMVADGDAPAGVSTLSRDTLLAVGLIVIGLLQVVVGLSEVVRRIVIAVSLPGVTGPDAAFFQSPAYAMRLNSDLATAIARLVIGMVLILGPRAVLGWLKRLRGETEAEEKTE